MSTENRTGCETPVKRLTILYFHRLDFPSASGQTIQVIRDYYAMAAHHDVHLFYRSRQSVSPETEDSLLGEHGAKRGHSFVLHQIADGLFGKQRFRRTLRDLVTSSSHPVVIVCRTLDHTQYAIRIATRQQRVRPVRTLLELHETAIPHLIYQQQQRPLRAMVSKLQENKLFRRVDGIIATVQPQIDLLHQLYPSHAPVVILPNTYGRQAEGGIQARERKTGGTFQIRYAGQFNSWKNTEILFRALSHLPENFALGLAGGKRGAEETTRQMIAELTKRYQLGKRVSYAGLLPPSAVPSFLAEADCLVLPLGDTLESRLFTSPIKLFEYAASQRPMVVTAQPTTSSLVTDGVEALMVPPYNDTELAEAVRRIADDPDLAVRLAANAKAWVTQFSPENRVARYNAFLNTILPA